MGWPQFLAWAATQGFKHTRFLKQAYSLFLAPRKWPGKEVILKKAKNLYDKFIEKVPTKKIADKVRKDIKKTVDEGKKVRKQMEKVKIEPEIRDADLGPRPSSELKAIEEGMKLKKGVVNIGDRIILQMQKQGKKVNFDDLLRIYGKKPPNLKADGGRIDKALPGRSRDI